MPVPTAESTQKDARKKLTRVVRILEAKYGPHIYPEEPNSLDQLIFALLAARNPVTNARKALRDFREAYVDWNEVRVATIRQIQETLEGARIEPAARYAETLKQLLERTFDEVLRVSLDPLKTDGPEKARKTVAKLEVLEPHEQQYVLVGAGVEEAPPLDPATDRIGLRLGIFRPEDSPARRRKLLESLVASPDALRFHHLMVEHGRKLCTATDPKCARCPAQGDCDHFRTIDAQKREAAREQVRAKKEGASAMAKPRKGKKPSAPKAPLKKAKKPASPPSAAEKAGSGPGAGSARAKGSSGREPKAGPLPRSSSPAAEKAGDGPRRPAPEEE